MRKLHAWSFSASAVLLLAGLLLISSGGAGRASGSDNEEPLELQLARARLALAEANLKKAERANARVRNAVSADVIDDYRQEAELARLHVERTQRGLEDPFPAWLSSAEANWKSANARWQSATAANRRNPGTVDELDVERFHLRALVSRLNFERGRMLAAAPRSAQLEWHVSVLNEEIERLEEQVHRSPPRQAVYLYFR